MHRGWKASLYVIAVRRTMNAAIPMAVEDCRPHRVNHQHRCTGQWSRPLSPFSRRRFTAISRRCHINCHPLLTKGRASTAVQHVAHCASRPAYCTALVFSPRPRVNTPYHMAPRLTSVVLQVKLPDFCFSGAKNTLIFTTTHVLGGLATPQLPRTRSPHSPPPLPESCNSWVECDVE